MGSETELNDDRRDKKRKRREEKNSSVSVCRDFLRNMCDRGSACKFEHPLDRARRYPFCHDFQHGYCHRKSCKFIHASVEDESDYHKTGQLPPHLLHSVIASNDQLPNTDEGYTEVAYCKKHLYGECWDEDCRFNHVTLSEYRNLEGRSPSPLVNAPKETAIQRHVHSYCKQYLWDNCWDNRCRLHHVTRNDFKKIEGRSPTPPQNRLDGNVFNRPSINEFESSENTFIAEFYEPVMKRPYIVENKRIDEMHVNGFDNSMQYQPERGCIMLDEENMMLRERITELKKRIEDLQVTNEFLLEQNARLRLHQDKNATGLTAMTVPAVTITNSVSAANQMQQNPTPQQMVTAALRTVTASVATVPVSIATVTPVSIATVTPVSISAVSMAPVQQMQGSVMTSQQGAAPGEQQMTTQPLSMSINAPSVPLVSYPILSRSVMQQSAPSLRH